jgi:hypothetical protein
MNAVQYFHATQSDAWLDWVSRIYATGFGHRIELIDALARDAVMVLTPHEAEWIAHRLIKAAESVHWIEAVEDGGYVAVYPSGLRGLVDRREDLSSETYEILEETSAEELDHDV